MTPARSRVDLAVYSLVAALALLAFVGPPLAGALDPRLRLSTLAGGAERDPWGSPWAHDAHGAWSLGPDRQDDARGDDDVVLLEADHPWLRAYRFGGELLFGACVAIAASWELLRAYRKQLGLARRPELQAELARCALLALPVALAATGGVFLVAIQLPAVGRALRQLSAGMVVAPGLAVFLTVYLAAAAVLLGLRLRRPRADEEPPKDGPAPDR